MQKLTRSLLFAGAVLGLAACGDDVSVTPPTPAQPAVITGVTVAPAAVTISIGEKVILAASVSVTQGTNPPVTTVTWSSANGTIATVSATGEVTGVAAGTTTIRATAVGDVSKVGAAAVTVISGVISVSIAPQTASLSVGGTLQAVASVQRTSTTISGAVTYSTSAANIATVSATGLITGVAVGTAVITATSTADPTKTASLAVTVVATPPNLTALSVAPTAAGLGVGGTVQIVPNATTVGNPTVAFTYTTSNAAVATVNATGLVTAVGNGTSIITTTATTNTNALSASTTITVASASVSISSITQANLPVNLANVGGQFEVTMNISAGNQTLDSVRVKLGTAPAATQTFNLNGAPNAPVTLSINSAAYTVNPDSTATVRFPNGVTTVQAELFTQGSSGPSASNTIQITLNNTDTFHARWTLPTNTATDLNGLIWYGGPGTFTVVNVIAVMYSGHVVESVTIQLDDASVDGNASLCGAAQIDATKADRFLATFTCTNAVNQNVQPSVVTSLRADGNPGPTFVVTTDPIGGAQPTLFANASDPSIAPKRIDTQAPTGFALTIPISPDNWFNNAFDFTTLVTTGTDNNGVGLADAATNVFEYADLPSTTWIAFTPGPNTIPEDPIDFTNAAYAARLIVKDRLGNTATVPQSGATTFGIDATAPSIEYLGVLTGTAASPTVISPAKDSVLHTTSGNNQGLATVTPPLFGVRIRDTRSGFNVNAANYLLRKITRLGVTGTVCAEGTPTVTDPCAFVAGTAPVGIDDPTYRRDSLVVWGTNVGQTSSTPGYYEYQTYALDRASNPSATVSKKAAIDVNAPQVTGINFPATLTGASSVAFVPNGSDDLEVISGALYLTYPNMTGGPLRYSSVSNMDSPWNATLATPVGNGAAFGSAGFTVPHGFLNGIDVIQAGNVPPPTVSLTYAPTGVGAQLYDIKRSAGTHTVGPFQLGVPDSSGVFNAPILPSQVTPGTPFSSVGVGEWFVFATGSPAGAAVQARAKTSTAITNPPFPQVAFFRLSGGTWNFLGTVIATPPTNPTIFDQGADRFWTYTLTGIVPSTVTGQSIRAVGMSAAGDGLSTSTYVVP